MLGRRLGRKAALWGAALGTLPDLDVLVPYATPVADFTYHRGFSHSWFVQALVTPLIAWLAMKIHAGADVSFRRWCVAIFAIFATHSVLDALTVYGTQLFWPNEYPVGISSLFIIDPAYTVPLLLGLLAALVLRRSARWLNGAGLALSTAYLLFSLGAKAHVERTLRASFEARGIEPQALLTTPAPFQTLLWRYVRVDADDRYAVGYYSLLDPAVQPAQCFGHQPELLANLADHWPVERLRWFTKGVYSVREEAGNVVMSDLRMGIEGQYVFRFAVAEVADDGAVVPRPDRQLDPVRDLSRLDALFARISDPEILFERSPDGACAATEGKQKR